MHMGSTLSEIHDKWPEGLLCSMEAFSYAECVALILRKTSNNENDSYQGENIGGSWTSSLSTLCHEALMHARSMSNKVVFTDHSPYGCADVGTIYMNNVLRFTLADATQAICVSHISKENTVLRYGIPAEKVYVIPNAVDTAMFKPAPERLPLMLWPRKSAVGEDERKAPLQDQVEMLGVVPHAQVGCVLISGHIFLNSSLAEAFCTAILEAASCGLLTVSARV